MSMYEKSIRMTSPEILSAASSAPNSRLSSPPLPPVDVVGAMVSITTSASVISLSSSGLSTSSSTGSVLTSEVDSSDRRSPSVDGPLSSDTLSRSPSLSTDLDGSNVSSISDQLSEPDPQIMEALRSKDRLYVLMLGELMEGLINDRRSRIETKPSTTYQRLLVHRCSAYYGLRPESDSVTKAINVYSTTDSKIPIRRICELVPAENKFQPAFKIMSRGQTNSKSKPHSQAGSVTGEDNDSSDIEPSEAGSLGGRSNTTGGSTMKKRPTIEERAAAYNEARSRIFMDFEEKEKEKDLSASSSTASLVSGSGSASGGGRSSDGDEVHSSPVTESERSAPVVRDRDKQRRIGSKRGSGNNSVASSSRSLRSAVPTYSGSGPSSSRGSRASSPSIMYGAHYDQGHGPTTYDNPYHAPYSNTSPSTEYPPHNPYVYQPYPPPGQPQQYYPYPPYYPPYPYPPPQGNPSEPSAQGPPTAEVYGTHSPIPPMAYGHPPYGWPPNMPPPHQLPPPHPMNHAPQHTMQSPQHGPNPLPSFPHHGPNHQSDHPPPQIQHQSNNPYGYMQASYPYPTPYYPPHPLQPPGPHGVSPPVYPPRSMNGMESTMGDHTANGQMSTYNPGHGNSSNGSVNHSRASSRSSMSSSLGNGGKGRGSSIPPLTRGPWSYGPGAGASGYQPSYNNPPNNDTVGPRLNNNRRMSGTSMSSSGYGSRDEASSTASSSTSSSSRRTYTSTASSQQHPLPARPDWAVGLKPQPTLASSNHARHHDATNRKVSPVSPSRGPASNGTSRQQQQPILHPADFPPLSNTDRETRAPTVAGAWSDSSPIRAAISPQRGSAGGSGDTDRGFERPHPKGSAELYNPKLPRKTQSPGGQHAISSEEDPSASLLIGQVDGLSLNDLSASTSPAN